MTDAARLLAVLLAVVAGCAGPDGGVEPLPVGSIQVFAEDVEPHLLARCASRACHGRSERALSLYAPGMRRLDPARTYLDEPLTATETEANARRLSAFADRARPERSLALRKPLAVGAGGSGHGGGAQFADTTDPAYRAMLAWLSTVAPDGGAP